MHDEICSFGLSRLAKEAGFPQDPDHNDHSQIYCWDGLRNIHSLCKWEMWYSGEYNNEDMYAAPTQSLLQRWLREEKGIVVTPFPRFELNRWSATYEQLPTRYAKYLFFDLRIEHQTYELALEDALKYTLENLV